MSCIQELSPTKRRSVVVTGVSTGIGFETAKALIVEGFHVFGSVRKERHAVDLRLDLGAAFTPLLFDVTDEAAIAKAVLKVEFSPKEESASFPNVTFAWV